MKLEEMLFAMDQATNEGKKYFAVGVLIGDATVPEVIVNTHENIKDKQAYYKNAYSEELTLKANASIRISGYVAADELNELESLLVTNE